MSQAPAAAGAARWAGSLAGRVARAWRVLPPERRLAAGAALGLFVTLFLPWYQETAVVNGAKLQAESVSLTGWGAFSFVEAAVLLVAISVIVLLIQRAEGRAFHLPGGDGVVITAAGLWTCVLIVWRIFDKQGTSAKGQIAQSSGIEWGIFVALAVAAVLAYAGSRIRAAHVPEPPLPGEAGPPEPAVVHAPPMRRGSRRARAATAARAASATDSPARGTSESGGAGGTAEPDADASAARTAAGRKRAKRSPKPPADGNPSAPAQTPPTLRHDERPTRRSTPATPDDQLTIPLEHDE
ncbi:MAG: hypothetical protein ACXVQR_07305 [Solirubrobacteraceae bacterium]